MQVTRAAAAITSARCMKHTALSSAADRKTAQAAQRYAEPEGAANTNSCAGLASANSRHVLRLLQPAVAHGRDENLCPVWPAVPQLAPRSRNPTRIAGNCCSRMRMRSRGSPHTSATRKAAMSGQGRNPGTSGTARVRAAGPNRSLKPTAHGRQRRPVTRCSARPWSAA
jgi:hypothetical protein